MRTRALQHILGGLRTPGLPAIAAALAVLIGQAGCDAPERPRVPAPRLDLAHEDADLDHQPGADDWAEMEALLGSTSQDHQPEPPTASHPTVSDSQGIHAIVLATFPGDDGTQARAWHRQLNTLLPATAGHVHIHVDDRGAVVLYGRYSNWEDPDARRDLESLNAIRINNARVFGPLMLTHIEPPRDPSTIGRWELASARLAHPDVRGLYTLEVAIWGDFESGELPPHERRQRAEEQVEALRTQGHEAYYHHDERRDLSTVTVGLFDDRAVDPRSGIASPRLERLRTTFPTRMVNGESFNVPVTRGSAQGGTRPQPSRLVEVPR